MPTLRNIQPDITLQSVISQLQQHQETKELRVRIEGTQESIQRKIQTVLGRLTGRETKFPALTGLQHPEQLSITGSEEDLSEAQSSAGDVDFHWVDENKIPLELKPEEFKLLTIVEGLFQILETIEAAILREEKNAESAKSQSREHLDNIARSFEEEGLTINGDKLDVKSFDQIVEEEANNRGKMHRYEWKKKVRAQWEERRKEIERNLESLNGAKTQERLGKIRALLGIKASQRDIITKHIEQYGSNGPEKTQNLSAISSGLEIFYEQLVSESRELGIEVEKKPHQSEDLQGMLKVPMSVKFAKKKREKKTPDPEKQPALPVAPPEPVITKTPPRSTKRLVQLLSAVAVTIGGAIGIAQKNAEVNTPPPPPPVVAKELTLPEMREKVHKYANFELDDTWTDYCKRKNMTAEELEIQLSKHVMNGLKYWLDEIGTLGNFPQIHWKIIPMPKSGFTPVVGGPNDLLLMEDQEQNWAENCKHHFQNALLSGQRYDPILRVLLRCYENYAVVNQGTARVDYVEMFPDIKKFPINTDPDMQEQQYDEYLEFLALDDAMRNYPGRSPEFIKRWLKKILTSPKENDFISAHLRDADAVSPGFRSYFEGLDFYKNTMNGTLTELDDVAFKNGTMYGVSVHCGQITQNGRTRWHVIPSAKSYFLVSDSGKTEFTFYGPIFQVEIPPGTRAIILMRDGVEKVRKEIPAGFQSATPTPIVGPVQMPTLPERQPNSSDKESVFDIHQRLGIDRFLVQGFRPTTEAKILELTEILSSTRINFTLRNTIIIDINSDIQTNEWKEKMRKISPIVYEYLGKEERGKSAVSFETILGDDHFFLFDIVIKRRELITFRAVKIGMNGIVGPSGMLPSPDSDDNNGYFEMLIPPELKEKLKNTSYSLQSDDYRAINMTVMNNFVEAKMAAQRK